MILSRANWTNRNAPWRESICTCAVLSILVAAPALLMINFLDPQLVLLGLSILLFSDAMIAALLAWAKSGNATLENVTLWDVAGALTMMGCAAAILGEPDQVALLFEQPVGQHSEPLITGDVRAPFPGGSIGRTDPIDVYISLAAAHSPDAGT